MEEQLLEGIEPKYDLPEVDCENCPGYNKQCLYYIDISHLIGFREFHLRGKYDKSS